MCNRSVEVVSVSQLLTRSFYIPAYQRGYRWTETQVEDLLNDIHQFFPREVSGSEDKTWYCLQPLVVKPVSKTDNSTENRESRNVEYELIDGQQRATTIYLIGHYINEMFRGKTKDPELSLRYETLLSSSKFLKDLSVDENDNVKLDRSDINFYHISRAYQTIHNWVKELNSKGDFKQDHFINVFLNHLKVIWCQSDENDSIAVFTRINMGKIPLTNAELIKALFLKNSNFTDANDSNEVYLKQMEIAADWDRMEAALHRPEFWYFLNRSDYRPETRIDLLFNLIVGKHDEKDKYSVFRKYNDDFKDYSKEGIEKKWEDVKRCFRTLEEWFDERERYHKIGFLIEAGEQLSTLVDVSRTKKKSKFLEYLDTKISEWMPNNLEDLEYKNNKVKLVLLLHNILTMLNNREEKSKFPFDRYKSNGGWDVEHIHSVTDKLPDNEKAQRVWLIASVKFIDEVELKSQITQKIQQKEWNVENFKHLALAVLNHLAGGKDDDDKDGLSNLALLDAQTNRSYQNAVFPVKRNVIIEREKAGTFVPICTKNIFMKLYCKNVSNFSFWSPEDRESYFADMVELLKPYVSQKGGSVLNEAN